MSEVSSVLLSDGQRHFFRVDADDSTADEWALHDLVRQLSAVTAERDTLTEVVGSLLDGLDSNVQDEGEGLSEAEWEVRIRKARAALAAVKKEAQP